MDNTLQQSHPNPQTEVQQAAVQNPTSTTKSPMFITLVALVMLGIGFAGGYFIANSTKNPPTTDSYQFLQSSPSITELSVQSTPVPEVSTTTKLNNLNLSDTTGWKTETIDTLQVKLPATAVLKAGTCSSGYQKCYLIEKHDPSLLSPPHITVKVKPYLGGSRRQEAGFELPLEDYTFTEHLFGNHLGLVAINNCKINNCTALREIIVVIDMKLIRITDGIYKNNDSTSTESIVTNAIVSSITN